MLVPSGVGFGGATGSRLAIGLVVTLAADHVERAEGGHDVGDHQAGDEPAERLGDGEARGADAHAVGRAAAVGDEVEAELAVAGLGVAVDSPAGTLMPSITILKCWMVPSMVV